jgi:Sulfotransferase domain
MQSSTGTSKFMTNKKSQITSFAVIIGAMKSGTTSLSLYLAQHPQMCRGVRKELNFFSSEKRWRKGRVTYSALWPSFDPAVHRYALDASPQYTKMPLVHGVPQRIQEFGGNFHYIYIVRNPIDRIESHLAHNIGMGRIPFRLDFNDPAVLHAISVSRYAYQLDTFRAGLNDPDVLLLNFDALCRTPLAVAECCAQFLGLEPFSFTPIEPVNVRKTAHRAGKFRLDDGQRALLAKRLRPDIIDFRDRYGFDVTGWGML